MEWNHDEPEDSNCPVKAESIGMEELITDDWPDYTA
jgi:hypothetical protein